MVVRYRYSTTEYDFAGITAGILGVSPLSELHTQIGNPEHGRSDQDSPAHRLFYENFDSLVAPVYYSFVRREILPLFGEDICVQRVPTFRVSVPGATAVREFHRDRDYNHQPDTRNFWVPLTKAFDTNTIWIETEVDSERYRPVNLEVGETLGFDAINLRHGNQINETHSTRVSFDFRVIPHRQYRSTKLRTVNRGVSFELGHYYVVMDRNGALSMSGQYESADV